MFNTVLIPVDGSESSHQATKHGLQPASLYGADVHLLYVLDSSKLSLTFDEPISAELEEAGHKVTGSIRNTPNRIVRCSLGLVGFIDWNENSFRNITCLYST